MQWYLSDPKRLQVFQGIIVEELVIKKIKSQNKMTTKSIAYDDMQELIKQYSI